MTNENKPDSNILRRSTHLLFAIASFLGTFFLIEQALLFFGVDHSSANGAAMIAGIVVLGYVMFPKKP